MQELYLTAEEQGERIDRFLSADLEDLSRSYIQKLVKEGGVLVNGNPVKANYKVNTGDDILVTVDLADFGSAVGTYTVPAEVTVLGRDVGVSGGPYRVRVTISEQTADQPAEPDVPAGENPDTGDETT